MYVTMVVDFAHTKLLFPTLDNNKKKKLISALWCSNYGDAVYKMQEAKSDQ